MFSPSLGRVTSTKPRFTCLGIVTKWRVGFRNPPVKFTATDPSQPYLGRGIAHAAFHCAIGKSACKAIQMVTSVTDAWV